MRPLEYGIYEAMLIQLVILILLPALVQVPPTPQQPDYENVCVRFYTKSSE